MAPFHRPDDNPTLALERDLEQVELLERLGYDEVWVGEHHSAGWETIGAPDIFIAMAAARTRQIRLGTGVVSLPYHHPLVVADRMVLLDHLTRGRVLFGVGPGALPSDAHMMGIKPVQTRPRMEEAMDAIVRLFTDPEPFTVKTDWFELNDAALQLRPYTRPHMPLAVSSIQSPAGMVLAGKHGAGVLSFGIFTGIRGAIDLKAQWAVAEESAARHGKTMCRDEWRLVVPVYVAESRQEALNDVRDKSARFITDYQHAVLGRPVPECPTERIVDEMVAAGSWIVGSPDDCAAAIEHLGELTGGFGGLMMMIHEWAPRDKLWRSYELFARYVMPRFQNSLVGIQGSLRRAIDNRPTFQANMRAAVEAAHETYERRRT